jgi:hypothetical protein
MYSWVKKSVNGYNFVYKTYYAYYTAQHKTYKPLCYTSGYLTVQILLKLQSTKDCTEEHTQEANMTRTTNIRFRVTLQFSIILH